MPRGCRSNQSTPCRCSSWPPRAGCSSLLTVQYALFTAAITTYAVLLADTLGEPALEAAGQRALATAIGIAIAAAAFLLWSNPRGGEEAADPHLAPPETAAR